VSRVSGLHAFAGRLGRGTGDFKQVAGKAWVIQPGQPATAWIEKEDGINFQTEACGGAGLEPPVSPPPLFPVAAQAEAAP
jgi:hypothetical protein